MRLEIKISEQDLLEFGKQAIERELQHGLTRLRLRHGLGQPSEGTKFKWHLDSYKKEASVKPSRTKNKK